MKRTVLCLLLAAALLAAASPASAFVYEGKAWCCKDVQFCVNPADFDTVCSGPGFDYVSQVLAAAATWNAQATSFQLVNAGLTNADGCRPDANGYCMPFMDGQNTVSINKACSLATGVLATTYIWYNQPVGLNDDCCVFEADICFSNDYSWYEDPDSLGCPGGCYDVQSVALHEFGHWIVLGHEDDAVAGPPVMQSTLGTCVVRRSLFPDDIAGLNYVYDAAGYIGVQFRCDSIHADPPNYPSSPKDPYQGNCPSQQCGGCISGQPWCDSTTMNDCLVICPSDDIVFRVNIKDQCGDPVCDPNCWIDMSNCDPVSIPCPTEATWPIIWPDSCDPTTGDHFFSVAAGLQFCDIPCTADIYVDGSFCRSVSTQWLDQNGDLCVFPDDYLGPNPCNDYNCNGAGDPADSAFFFSHLDHCCAGPCQGNGPFCDSVTAPSCLNICPEGDVLYTAQILDSCGNPVCDLAGTYIDFSSCQLVRPCPNYHPDWPRVYPDSCDPATGKHFWSIHAISECSVCDPTLVITDGNGNQIACKTLTARLFDTDFSMCVDQADFIGQLCNDYDCNGTVDAFDQGIWQNHFGHCCAGPCQGNGPFCDSLIAPVCLNICPEGDVVYSAIVRDSCGNPLCDTLGTFIDFSNCPDVIPCPNFHPDWPLVHPDSCDPATGELFWSIHAGGSCVQCNPVLTITDANGTVVPCKTLEARTYDTNGNLCVDQGDFIAGALCNDYNCDGTVDAIDNNIWAPHFGHCCGPCMGNGPFCDSTIAPICLNICPDGDVLYTAVLRDSCGMPVCDTAGTWIDFSNCPDVIPCPNMHPNWPLVKPDSCDPTTGEHFWSIHAGGFCVSCFPALVISPLGGPPVPCQTLRARIYDTDGDLCVTDLDWIPNDICNDYNCDGAAGPIDQTIWAPHIGHCCANLPSDTCEFYKSPYKDYAPQGMPDFDHKQDPNWVDAIGQWSHDGPAAVANCLWWFDSKFEPNPVDPRPFGVTPPNDGYPLVTAYGNWDDHDTSNVAPLINELATWMSTNVGPSGTVIDSLVSGTRQYMQSRGVLGEYSDTLVHWPSYQYIAGQVLRSCDVILQIGLYERYADGTCCRVGAHYVTAAGACTTKTVVCISDPYLDQLEGEPPAGAAHGATVHNDANNISGPHNQIQHDPLPLSPAQIQCLNNGQPVEIATTYPVASIVANFLGVNGGDPTCPPSQLTGVIEYAYVICPCCVLRGDVDSDNALTVSDLTFLVSYLFQGGPPPDCLAEADVNGDGAVNISDLTYLAAFLFQGGPPPVPCP